MERSYLVAAYLSNGYMVISLIGRWLPYDHIRANITSDPVSIPFYPVSILNVSSYTTAGDLFLLSYNLLSINVQPSIVISLLTAG